MESLPARRPHPRRPRAGVRPTSVVASVALTGVVLVTGISIAVADDQTAAELGGEAAKYVPVDGHLEWVGDNLGSTRMTESSRSIGFEDILLLPTPAGNAVVGLLGEDSRVAQLWRESTLTVTSSNEDETGVQTVDLHRLSTDGLSMLAGYGGSIGFAYSPPLLELPSDVAPGSTWSSAGDALPGGILTYVSEATASVPSHPELIAAADLADSELDDCLQTDGSSIYRDSDGVTILDIVEADLWCLGRGRVAIVATVNGGPVVQGPTAAPSAGAQATQASAPAWGSGGDWRAVETATRHLDAFFGEQPLPVSLANPPRRTDSGLVVAVNQSGDDVVALRPDAGALVRDWIAHPGGEVITVETVGDVVIVTTSQRRVLAYSDTGQRLWALDVPELILAPPTAGSDGTVVLVGLDGTLLRADATTGEVAWRRALNADVSVSATAEGERIVAVDRAGAVTALDRRTGDTVWRVDTGQVPTHLVAGAGRVLVVGDDGFVRALDSDTGERVWQLRYTGNTRAAVVIGDIAIVATDESTRAVDLASGAVRWSRGGAQDVITDGASAVAFGESTAQLVDASGATLAEWTMPSLSLAIYRYAVAGDDGFWVFRSNQPALKVGRP